MTDPWEGIRHTLSVMPAQSLIPDPIMGFLVADGKKLLADADALLHVKRAAEAQNRMWNSPVVSEALAALPDYLKGE